jgi:plastocyanin
MNRRILTGGLLGIFGLGAGVAKWSDAPDLDFEPSGTPQASAVAERVLVEIARFEFVPVGVTVRAGTRVIWVNRDAASHTVTADDGAFDSGPLRLGGRFGHTFEAPGRYSYFCAYHANMTGVVTVEN